MSKWTPEPWDDFGGMLIASDESRINVYDNNGNRARIVACVNAMAGIPDPAAFVERARRIEDAATMFLNTIASLPDSARFSKEAREAVMQSVDLFQDAMRKTTP